MHNIDGIKFSVVIPTRERASTLGASIRTCVTQDYDNFEIIVSDNDSQDDTKEIVEAFRDQRIIYVNTGKRVAMSENWEFGLKQVSGDFVIFLGDDDALLPGALKELRDLIKKYGCAAISWHGASYYWPCCVIDRAPNFLTIPLKNSISRRNGDSMLREVLSFKRSLYELPSIYLGVISRKIINTIKEKSNGQFFHALSPDFYSAIVLSAAVGTYYFSTKPYSIFGQSQHSMGAAFLYGPKEPDAGVEHKFFNEPNIPSHAKLALGPSTWLVLANAFMQAKEQFPPLAPYEIDLRELIKQAIDEMVHEPREKFARVAAAVSEIAQKNSLGNYADELLKNTKNVPWINIGIDVPGYNIFRHHFNVDCSIYGVRDVYQASIICKLILEYQKAGMSFSLISIVKSTLKLVINLMKRWYYAKREVKVNAGAIIKI